jgi:hypothetical protein
MAQIIKHRRGSLESLSAVTSSLVKGEIVIASGSSNLTTTNGSSIVFAVPQDGQVQAVNRFLIGSSAPATFAAGTYNGMVNGVPFYDSGSGTLYLLGSGENTAINLVGNIQPFSSSVATSINALSASIGSGTIGSSVSALNTFTSSQEAKNTTLATYTASVDGHIFDINAYTASNNTANTAQNNRLTNLESTSASVNTSIASINGHISDINTKTGSFETKFSTLQTYTASVDSKFSEIHSYTASLRAALTASGADVTFSGDVTIPGNLTVAGTQTIVDSTTVQIGDNILELNGSGAANGGLWIKDPTAPNNATGSLVWDSTNDYWKAGVKGSEIKVLLAGGDSVVSGSSQINFTELSGISANIISSSSDTANVDMIISGGSISANLKGGVVSGSSQITISDTTGYSTFSSSIATNVVELFATSSDHESRIDTIESSIGGGGSLGSRVESLESSSLSLNSFTASAAIRLNNLESTSASVNGHISDINTWSGSAKTSITNLETKAGTLQTYTASVDGHISDINTWSASVKGHISDINAYTASNDTTNTAQSSRLSNIEAFTSSFGTSFSTSVDSRLDTLEGTGTIQGVGTGNNVTFAKVTTTGDVIVGGDLVVQGNTTTLNTAQLVIEDKIITLASGSTSNATADGAGLEIAGTSAKFTYNGTTNEFSSSVAVAANLTGSVNVPGFGTSKRAAFRNAAGNLDFVTAPSTAGDLLQWDGSDFVMSNVIDGGSF